MNTRIKTVMLAEMLVILVLISSGYADLSDGLVAYWPFNGNAVDESGNGNDGIVIGATLTDDRFDNPDSAYFFDGVDDYINIGNNVKPPLPLTVSIWIKVETLDSRCVFRNDRYNNAAYRNGIALNVRADGTVAAHVFEGFSAYWNRQSKISNDSVVTIDSWHHFAVVFTPPYYMQLLFDGVEIEGYYAPDGTGSGLSYSSANGAIGLFYQNIGGSGVARYFHGCIDDIYVYNRALSVAEIYELYISSPVPPPDNSLPVAVCQDVIVEAGEGCAGDALIDDGSYDPDGDAITIEQDPAGPYPLGVTTVTLTVTDEHGATDSCEGHVTVQDTTPPIISATVTPQNVSIGQEVSFVVVAIEDECDPVIEWDFGDGGSSTDPSTTHSYGSYGEYTVTLYVIDSSGNESTEEFTVVVSGPAEIRIDIKPGSCPNPFNAKSKGSVPVAIIGTADFDVSQVDLSTLTLAGVPVLDIVEVADVTQPDGDNTDCFTCFDADDPANFNCDLWDATVTPAVPGTDGVMDSYCGDGYPDLIVKFDAQDLAAAIGPAERDDCVTLTLIGELLDGTQIEASDSVVTKSTLD